MAEKKINVDSVIKPAKVGTVNGVFHNQYGPYERNVENKATGGDQLLRHQYLTQRWSPVAAVRVSDHCIP